MNPIFLSFGDFYIAWYGILVAAGLLSGTLLSSALARREGLDPVVVIDLLIVIVVGMLVGARMFYIFTVWGEFLRDPLPHLLSRNGYVFLGGLVGGMLAALGMLKWRGIPVARTFDVLAPAVPVGHALGRVGCHMTGCCYGGICPTGSTFACLQVPPAWHLLSNGKREAVGGYAWFDQVEAGLIGPSAPYSLPVYPTQLLEAAGNMAIAGALLYLFFRRGWKGQVVVAYFIMYPLLRFALEFMRGDAVRGVYSMAGLTLSFSQWLSLSMLVAAVALYVLGTRGMLKAWDAPWPEAVRLKLAGSDTPAAHPAPAAAAVAPPPAATAQAAPAATEPASRRPRSKPPKAAKGTRKR